MSLAINTVGDELQSSADYCRAEGIGLEITDFALPWNLDSNQKYFIDKHIKTPEAILVVESDRLKENKVSIEKLKSFLKNP